MEKEFLDYIEALELKKLGFNEPCFGFYDDIDDDHPVSFIRIESLCDKLKSSITLAPLYQQAFRWFREKYGLYAEIFVDDNKTFGFYITSFIKEGRLDKPITRQFNTYDEAELGCVKQLIEIIDRKDEAYQ